MHYFFVLTALSILLLSGCGPKSITNSVESKTLAEQPKQPKPLSIIENNPADGSYIFKLGSTQFNIKRVESHSTSTKPHTTPVYFEVSNNDHWPKSLRLLDPVVLPGLGIIGHVVYGDEMSSTIRRYNPYTEYWDEISGISSFAPDYEDNTEILLYQYGLLKALPADKNIVFKDKAFFGKQGFARIFTPDGMGEVFAVKPRYPGSPFYFTEQNGLTRFMGVGEDKVTYLSFLDEGLNLTSYAGAKAVISAKDFMYKKALMNQNHGGLFNYRNSFQFIVESPIDKNLYMLVDKKSGKMTSPKGSIGVVPVLKSHTFPQAGGVGPTVDFAIGWIVAFPKGDQIKWALYNSAIEPMSMVKTDEIYIESIKGLDANKSLYHLGDTAVYYRIDNLWYVGLANRFLNSRVAPNYKTVVDLVKSNSSLEQLRGELRQAVARASKSIIQKNNAVQYVSAPRGTMEWAKSTYQQGMESKWISAQERMDVLQAASKLGCDSYVKAIKKFGIGSAQHVEHAQSCGMTQTDLFAYGGRIFREYYDRVNPQKGYHSSRGGPSLSELSKKNYDRVYKENLERWSKGANIWVPHKWEN